MLYKVNEIQKDERTSTFFFSSTLGEKRSSTCKVGRGWGRKRGDAERGREPERERVVDRGVSRPEFQRVTLGTMTS